MIAKKYLAPWLDWARSQIGVKETGSNNPIIVEYWRIYKMSGIKNEKIAWCSAFVGAALEKSGINTDSKDKTKAERRVKEAAKYWLYWDGGIVRKETPSYGCIAVMDRRGGGHVGFIVGQTPTHWILLGGNQGNAVKEAKFPKSSFIGYVLPEGFEPNLDIPFADAPIENNLS